MKVLVSKEDQVIIDIVDIAYEVENGLFTSKSGQELIYGQSTSIDVYDVATIPAGVKPQSHKYDGTNFTINANYVPYLDPQQTLTQLKKDFYTPSTPVDAYNSIDLNTVSLADLKTAKIAQLNYQCTEAILAGFVSSALGTPHTYSFDYQAQIRFSGELAAINDPTFTDTTAPWNTKENGYLSHTLAQFRQLFKDGQTWTKTNMGKYFTLKGQVLAITDPTKNADVNAIVW